MRMADARQNIEEWQVDYNETRSHSRLSDQPPAESARNETRPDPASAPTRAGWPILAEPRSGKPLEAGLPALEKA